MLRPNFETVDYTLILRYRDRERIELDLDWYQVSKPPSLVRGIPNRQGVREVISGLAGSLKFLKKMGERKTERQKKNSRTQKTTI
jgi:hypothetical protein